MEKYKGLITVVVLVLITFSGYYVYKYDFSEYSTMLTVSNMSTVADDLCEKVSKQKTYPETFNVDNPAKKGLDNFNYQRTSVDWYEATASAKRLFKDDRAIKANPDGVFIQKDDGTWQLWFGPSKNCQ